MQNVDIQQLNANLQALLTKDAVAFVEMVIEVLVSDTSKAYFQEMENAVLEEIVEKNLELKEEQDVCILFLINELLQKNENVVEDGAVPYGNLNKKHFYMSYKMIFNELQPHFNKRNKTKIDAIISEVKDINALKEDLKIITKQDFKLFLNILTNNIFSKKHHFEDAFFHSKKENEEKNISNFSLFFLALSIDLIGSFFEKGKANNGLDSFYEKMKFALHKLDINIEDIFETKIKLLKKQKRTKQLDQFLGESFERFDAVYKALS